MKATEPARALQGRDWEWRISPMLSPPNESCAHLEKGAWCGFLQAVECFRNQRFEIFKAIAPRAHEHDRERKFRKVLLELEPGVDSNERVIASAGGSPE
jgi:hypothetical protein